MRSTAFTIASALSLLLCAIVLLLWITFRTAGQPGQVASFTPSVGLWLQSDAAAIQRLTPIPPVTGQRGYPDERGPFYRVDPVVRVPYGLIAGTLLLLPATWAASACAGRARKRRRRSLGLCPTCGYDVRATRDRCPECGTPASSAAV